jgi:hypothetical protein
MGWTLERVLRHKYSLSIKNAAYAFDFAHLLTVMTEFDEVKRCAKNL